VLNILNYILALRNINKFSVKYFLVPIKLRAFNFSSYKILMVILVFYNIEVIVPILKTFDKKFIILVLQNSLYKM